MADFEVSGTASIDGERLITSVDEILNKFDELKIKIDELDAKLDELSHKEVKINVLIEGMDKLDELKLFLDELESHEYSAKIKVDIQDKDKLDKLYLDILELELTDHNVDITVKTDGIPEAEAKIQALDKTLDDNKKKTDDAKNSADKFKFSWMLLAPALLPISALLVTAAGGVLGLASALVTTIVPAIGFGLAMKSMYSEASTLVSGLTAAQQAALSNATTFGQVTSILDKSSTAYQNMDSYMRNVVTEYVLMKNAVSAFQDAVEPQVAVALANMFKVIQVFLADITPAVQQFGSAFADVLATLLQRLQDPTFQKWFRDMATWMGVLTTAFGDGFINIIEGIVALLDAFLPLGVKMSLGFLKMTRDFDIWAQHLAQSQGFKTFVATVERDGPLILGIIGQIILLIGHLVGALGTQNINGSIFGTILKFLEGINKYLGTHASLTQMAADLTLVAIAAWKLGPALGPLLSFIATPVGAVVLGIAALAAGFIYLYIHSKAFHDWVQTNLLPMFEAIKKKAVDMKNFLVGVWPEIQAVWKKYGANILAIILADFRFIEATIINVMTFIQGFINLILGLLSGNWHQVWHGISQMFSSAWHEILAVAIFFGNTFMNVFSMMWKFVGTLFSSALHGIENNFNTNMKQIEGWVSNAYHAVVNTVKTWMAEFTVSIANGLVGVLNFFARLPTDILHWIGNLGSLLYNAGVSLISGLISGIENSVPGLSSVLSWVTNLIPNLKGPPSKDRDLLKKNGELVIMGFIDGLESKYAAVEKSLGTFTNTLGTNMGKKLSTDLTARINGSLSGTSGGVAGAMGRTGAGAAGGGSGATQVTFAPGSIQINNPVAEQPGITLTRTMQGAAKFGTIQGTAGSRMT